jgi:hypothetical protein
MKRRLLPAAALALLPAVVHAQATAPVQVTVLTEVQLTRTGTTDFGPVGTLGQTYTINPRVPSGAQQTALFTAKGVAGASIVVSWASTLDLCHETAGCGTKLVFTPDLSSLGSFSCFGCNQSTSTVLTNPSKLPLNSDGEHYIWLGGSVAVNAGQTPGVYTGVFTLVATYE